MPYPLISIVVINHNKQSVLRRCLDSVLSLDWPELEVICVDNASDDGSAEMVETVFADRVQLLRRASNSVTAARNDGYRAARGEYCLSIDNDIVFPDPQVLRRGIDFFDRFPGVGILAFLIGTQAHPREPLAEHWWYEVPMDEGKHRSFYTAYFSEGAVLIRRAVIEATGGYDEDFFRGAENLDLILKVFRENWQILFSADLYCAELEVRGRLEVRRTQRNYLSLRNKLWALWKHYPLWRGLCWAVPRIGMAAVRSLRYGWLDLFFLGLRDGVFAPAHIRNKRRPLNRETWRRLRQVRPVRFVSPRE